MKKHYMLDNSENVIKGSEMNISSNAPFIAEDLEAENEEDD